MGRKSTQEHLLTVAAAQRGIAGREQLIHSGVSAATVSHCCRAKRLHPVFRGAYAVGREVESREAVWWAAVIAGGYDGTSQSGCVLSGRTAAEAWGILSSRDPLPRSVEVARQNCAPRVMKAVSPRLRGTRLHCVRRSLRPGDVARASGIPAMSLVRVLVDLAAHHPADLRTGFMEGSRLGLIDWRVVKFCVERSLGLPGSSEIRGLAGIWVPELRRIRSVLEGQFLLSWLEIGGKVPEVNVSMGPWSLDFLWREEGVVVETDGRAFHGHHMAREKDVRKDAWLAARGIKVIHLGYDEVNDPSGNAMHIVAQALKRVRGVVFGRYTPTNDTTCPLS